MRFMVEVLSNRHTRVTPTHAISVFEQLRYARPTVANDSAEVCQTFVRKY